MGNGSQFKTGSDIIGLGKIKEGYAVFDGTLDENGNRVFKAGSSGVLKVEGSNGVNYSIDTEGVRTQLFKKEDSNLLTNDKQKIVEVNGKQYIVNVDDGKDKAGGWFGIGSDNDVNIDGKWYDESKLQEIVEINDAEGNGTEFISVCIKTRWLMEQGRLVC